MTLPTEVGNAVVWSRFKNVILGPFEYTHYDSLDSQLVTTTSVQIGLVTPNQYQEAAYPFTLDEDTYISFIDVGMWKANSPVDDVLIQVRPDSAGSPSATVTAEIAHAGADIPFQTATTWLASGFAQVFPAGSWWIVMDRSGADEATNRYRWNAASTDVLPGRVGKGRAGGTWSNLSALNGDLAFNIRVGEPRTALGVVVGDDVNNYIRFYRSLDNGETWSQWGTNPIENWSTTAAWRSVVAAQSGDAVYTFSTRSPGSPLGNSFWTNAGAWQTEAFPSPSSLGLDVGGTVAVSAARRSDDLSWVVAHQAATETSRRRMAVCRRTFGGFAAWSADSDLITGTSSLPGTAVDYDHRGVLPGSSGRTHFFWTQSDEVGALKTRVQNSDLSFTSIVSISGANVDEAAFYPVGMGDTYTDGTDTYLAVPYVDPSDGFLKLARCESSVAHVGSNWTVETIAEELAEVTTSNPCGVSSDAGQKLWAWWVSSDDKTLRYSADGGTGSWSGAQSWKPESPTSIGAISMRVLSDRVGIIYYDELASSIKYDALLVYFSMAGRAAGAYETVRDLGEEGVADYLIFADVSGTSGVSVVITAETYSDLGSTPRVLTVIGADENSTQAEGHTGQTDRYLKITEVITGGDTTAGVAGI